MKRFFCSRDCSLVLVDGALGRLRKLLALTAAHVSPEFNENRLHGVFTLPVGEARQLGGIDDTVSLVDAWEVDHADELDRGWLVGVVLAAVHLYGVDSVLVHALQE